MPTIFRRFGNESNASKNSEIDALFIWCFILIFAAIFLLVGTLLSSSWMIIVSSTLIALLIIIELWQLIVGLGNFLIDKASSRWNRVGEERE